MPTKIFIAFAEEDRDVRDKLVRHMKLMSDAESEDWDIWAAHQIEAGAIWDAQIEARLNDSEVIILLMSVDFFDSEYVRVKELPTAVARHKDGACHIIPVIARECLWKNTPFGRYTTIGDIQALPSGERPITVPRFWDSKDAPYVETVVGIRDSIQAFRQRKAQEAAEAAARKQAAAASEAKKKAENDGYRKAEQQNTEQSWEAFLKGFPDSSFLAEAQKNLKALRKIRLDEQKRRDKEAEAVRKEQERLAEAARIADETKRKRAAAQAVWEEEEKKRQAQIQRNAPNLSPTEAKPQLVEKVKTAPKPSLPVTQVKEKPKETLAPPPARTVADKVVNDQKEERKKYDIVPVMAISFFFYLIELINYAIRFTWFTKYGSHYDFQGTIIMLAFLPAILLFLIAFLGDKNKLGAFPVSLLIIALLGLELFYPIYHFYGEKVGVLYDKSQQNSTTSIPSEKGVVPSCTAKLNKYETVIIGIENALNISLQGLSFKEVEVKMVGAAEITGMEQFEQTGPDSTVHRQYLITANQVGQATLTVSGKGLNYSTVFNVEAIPDPVPLLQAKYSDGNISRTEFTRKPGGIALIFTGKFDSIDCKCAVMGYTVVKGLRKIENTEARFKESLPLIREARPGDKYQFNDIMGKCPGDRYERNLGNLVFKIK